MPTSRGVYRSAGRRETGKRHGTAYRHVWCPSPEQVEAVCLQYFMVTADDFECVRQKTVGETVALALGIPWSPRIGSMTKAALTRMGARLAVFNHVAIATRVRPRHFDRSEAVKLSMEIRGRKTAPKESET